ncbi:MAG: hypothetical protein HFG02_11895 [Oscillibacter sp.]|nr:hypothetical protein [Oscillibacter sp.]
MTSWTLFFTILGVAFLTAQLFRLIDLIEHPSHPAACRKPLPEPRTLLLWTALRKRSWTFWKS